MELFEDAAASIVDALGEPFVYFDGEQTVEITAVPSSGWSRIEAIRGPAVSSRRRVIQITSAAVAEPKQGDLVFRGELAEFEGTFDFQVVDAQPDDEETTFNLVLKVYEQ